MMAVMNSFHNIIIRAVRGCGADFRGWPEDEKKFIFNCSMEDASILPRYLVPVMARRPRLSMQKNQFGMRVTGSSSSIRSFVRNGELVVVLVVLR